MTKKQMKLLIKKREKLGYYSAPSILIDTLYPDDNEEIEDEFIDFFSHKIEESRKLIIYCGTELYEKLEEVNKELQETERLKLSN
jgi:hypothetical protein